MVAILFEHPRAVMVRIPKTGSTSIVRGIFGGVREGDVKHHGPIPLSWQQHYCFAFVRNPFERMVSAFFMFQSYPVKNAEERTFRDHLSLHSLMDVIQDDSIPLDKREYFSKLRVHSLPMTHSHFGLDSVDEIFRFEDYSESSKRLCQKLKIETIEVPHFRKKNRAHWRTFFGPSELERACELLSLDCSTFGYSLDET